MTTHTDIWNYTVFAPVVEEKQCLSILKQGVGNKDLYLILSK